MTDPSQRRFPEHGIVSSTTPSRCLTSARRQELRAPPAIGLNRRRRGSGPGRSCRTRRAGSNSPVPPTKTLQPLTVVVIALTTTGLRGIPLLAAQRAVQLFLHSWAKGLFVPISISEAAHLFTKQLLCQLSYAGVL